MHSGEAAWRRAAKGCKAFTESERIFFHLFGHVATTAAPPVKLPKPHPPWLEKSPTTRFRFSLHPLRRRHWVILQGWWSRPSPRGGVPWTSHFNAATGLALGGSGVLRSALVLSGLQLWTLAVTEISSPLKGGFLVTCLYRLPGERLKLLPANVDVEPPSTDNILCGSSHAPGKNSRVFSTSHRA